MYKIFNLIHSRVFITIMFIFPLSKVCKLIKYKSVAFNNRGWFTNSFKIKSGNNGTILTPQINIILLLY